MLAQNKLRLLVLLPLLVGLTASATDNPAPYTPPTGFTDLDEPDGKVADSENEHVLRYARADATADGTVYVVWDGGWRNGPHGPLLARGDMQTGLFDDSIDLDMFATGIYPDIAVDECGTAHVVYCSYDSSAGIWSFYYLNFDSQNVIRNFQVVHRYEYHESRSTIGPRIDVTPDGQVHILIPAPSAPGNEHESKLLYIHGYPDKLSAPETIATALSDFGGLRPQLAVDQLGNLHVIASEQRGVWYVKRALDGTWSEPILTDSRMRPSMTVDREGVVHIASLQFRGLSYINNRSGSFCKVDDIRASGSLWDHNPGIACDSDGNVYISWLAGNAGGAGNSTYMALISKDGRIIQSSPVSIRTAGSVANPCLVSIDDPDYAGNVKVLSLTAGVWPLFSRIQTN